MLEDILAGLNKEQRRAVKTTEGPLLIQAGAGSGKTKTLTHRVAYLIFHHKVNPYNILAVTFTNKAANEMRSRVWQLMYQSERLGANNSLIQDALKQPPPRSFMPFMGTFHSICVRLLRQDGEQIGVPRSFVIFDEADRLSALKQASKQLLIDEKVFPPRLLGSLISSAKNAMVSAVDYNSLAESPAQITAAKVYPLYDKILKNAMALDFDDLIKKTVTMLSTQYKIRSKWQQQFRYIMIDEYQDTNLAQYQLIKLLTNSSNNIAVVGDDWQGIFGWRQADFRNILNFEKDYLNCAVIKLEQNYRSTKHILNAAHNVITKNQQRSDKKLWTQADNGLPVQILQTQSERMESETIIQRVRKDVSMGRRRYRDFTVLYRTNAQSRPIEETFIRYGIPYRIVGGQRFYDRKEIKDIVAYMRLIYQPEDQISFERIVNIPTRGIGSKSLDNFYNWLTRNNYSLSKALERVEECQELTPAARKGFSDLQNILISFRDNNDFAPSVLIESLLKRLDYLKFLNDGTPQGESRQENVKELISVAKSYQAGDLADFLEQVALMSDVDQTDFSSDSVTLMTLHSAKGLEFPVVFMVGLEETILPHTQALYDQAQLEEERRLCYVGMTRAREELYMIYAINRLLYGRVQHNPPSRFLSEIESQFSEFKPSSLYSAFTQFGSNNSQMINETTEPYHVEMDLDNAGNINAQGSDTIYYLPDLIEGDRVKHNLFGTGTVTQIDGDNVAIHFDGNASIKKFDITFATLEKIS